MEPKRPGPVPRAPASDEETRPAEARQKATDPAAGGSASRASVAAAPPDARTEAAPPPRRAARPPPPPIEETDAGPPPRAAARPTPELPKPKKNRGAVPEAPRANPTRT